MSGILNHLKRVFIFTLVFILAFSITASADHLKNDVHAVASNYGFTIVILGDSQMAGTGWDGGYQTCISETYPNSKIINLAHGGDFLVNGDILKQWEYYLSNYTEKPDFILLDGGINDLSHVRERKFQKDVEKIKDSLHALVTQIHEDCPDAHMIYTLMPPLVEWDDEDYGPPSYDRQKTFWRIMNINASQYSYITVLDLFSLNPFRYPCSECYQEYFSDSVHLSEAGYRKTFEYIDNIILANLSEKLFD